jgi:tetratricopeptide (TPR) repeat protein
MERKEKALDIEYISILDTVNNLGLLYKNQGKLDETEEIYMGALKRTGKVLGVEYTSILRIINNLGLLHKDQGKLNETEKIYILTLTKIDESDINKKFIDLK